jgi:glutamate carboxypeptidase
MFKKMSLICLILITIVFSVYGPEATFGDTATIDSHWLNVFEKTVNINSDATNSEGIEKNRLIFCKEFEALGFETKIVPLNNNRKLLYFQMKNASPEIMLLGHTDTVFKPESSFKKFDINQDKINGPGVIDMKGGIILMLNVLSDLKNRVELLRKIRIVLTEEEETGSINSQAGLRSLASGIKYCLIFEPGMGNGNFVTGCSGVKWIKISVKGKSARAGLEHDKGVNACVELSYKIVEIAKLTDYSKGITVNPGIINGGTKPNVVPEEASVVMDIRYKNQSDLETVLGKINVIVKKQYVYNKKINCGTTSKIMDVLTIPALPETKTDYIMNLLKQIGKKESMEIDGNAVGYGCDANFIADLNDINIIVGVGPYGGGMHTNDEFMSIAAYLNRLTIVKKLLIELDSMK